MNRIKIAILLVVVGWLPLFGMLPVEDNQLYTWFYPVDNHNHDLYRKRVALKNVSFLNPPQACVVEPSIVVKMLPQEKRIGVCYDYAMKKILRKHGIDINFPLVGCQYWVNQLSFFKPVKNIKKGDLIVYVDSLNHLRVRHFAVVQYPSTRELGFENMRVKDKWGTMKALMTHCVFDLPISWGNVALVFRLKKIYRVPNVFQVFLFGTIVYEHLFSSQAQEIITQQKLKLFDLANKAIDSTNLLQRLVVQHLEQCTVLSVDMQDDCGDTPLIKAVRNNNISIARIFCDYGANLGMENVYGDTALITAQRNNNREMIALLQRYIISTEMG